jgi:hypothetical protein
MGNNLDTKSSLHNAITAAKGYYTAHESSYEGLNAAALAQEAAGINFIDGSDPVTPGAVYVFDASENEYRLRCKSLSGRVFTVEGNRLTVVTDF